MIYFVDGYCLGSNPSKEGGGYTIVNKKNKLIKTERILKIEFTNNEAELLAILNGLKIAKAFDAIITDSQVCLNWVLKGAAGSRFDLNSLASEARIILKEKKILVGWLPRETNLAGQYNEQFEGWMKNKQNGFI